MRGHAPPEIFENKIVCFSVNVNTALEIILKCKTTPSNFEGPSKLIHVLSQLMFVQLGGPGGGRLAATRSCCLVWPMRLSQGIWTVA